MSKLIDETKGEIVINGGRNEAKLKIGITVVTGVKEDDLLMEDEIFGPVLPILVKDKEATVAYLRKLPSPLATYYFGSDKQTRQFRTPRLLLDPASLCAQPLTCTCFSNSVRQHALGAVRAGRRGLSVYRAQPALRWRWPLGNGRVPRQVSH